MKTLLKACLLFSLLWITACQDDLKGDKFLDDEYAILSEHLNIPEETYDYSVLLPDHLHDFFPDAGNQKEENLDHKATLGRVLFYDTQLSHNHSVSCASCHKQELAFGDNVSLSKGFDGQLGHRNSLALANTVGFETSYGGGDIDLITEPGILPLVQFSWDDSVPDLMQQSKAAITNPLEMGMKMHEVVQRLEKVDYYAILFKKAFGSVEVTEDKVLEALRTFCNSLASVDTKFDRVLDEEGKDPFFPFSGYSEKENKGKTLYMQHCSSCHGFNHAVVSRAIANNGLDMVYEDQGKGAKTGNEFEMGVFKIPFLRNIALTAPYMHDGRFNTLYEVIDHYSKGIQNHPNLAGELKTYDPSNQSEVAVKMNFSENQKEALIAFLHTLTDETLIEDNKFSDPFIK